MTNAFPPAEEEREEQREFRAESFNMNQEECGNVAQE